MSRFDYHSPTRPHPPHLYIYAQMTSLIILKQKNVYSSSYNKTATVTYDL